MRLLLSQKFGLNIVFFGRILTYGYAKFFAKLYALPLKQNGVHSLFKRLLPSHVGSTHSPGVQFKP